MLIEARSGLAQECVCIVDCDRNATRLSRQRIQVARERKY